MEVAETQKVVNLLSFNFHPLSPDVQPPYRQGTDEEASKLSDISIELLHDYHPPEVLMQAFAKRGFRLAETPNQASTPDANPQLPITPQNWYICTQDSSIGIVVLGSMTVKHVVHH